MNKKILMLCLFVMNMHQSMGHNGTTSEMKEDFVFTVTPSTNSGITWNVTAPKSQKPARVQEITLNVTALDEMFSPRLRKTEMEYDPTEFYKKSNSIVITVAWKNNKHAVTGESFYNFDEPHTLKAFDIFYKGEAIKKSPKNG